MGSSSHLEVIMARGQEANGDNLGESFSINNCMLSTRNIQFLDKTRKFPKLFVFLSYRKNLAGTQKQVLISHDK